MAIKSQQLRQSFLISGAGAAVLLVVFVAWLTSNRAGAVLEQQANVRGRDVATRVAAIVTHYLKERRREAVALATQPQIIAAVREAAQSVSERGLTRASIPDLEQMFSGTRQLGGGDAALRDYLRAYTTISDFAEIIVTESHGFNVLTSSRASDFVQRDETWWQRAMADGSYEGQARFDSSSNTASLEFDVAIRPRAQNPIGVLKAVFPLERLTALLGNSQLAGDAYLEIVDGRRAVLVAKERALLLQTLPDSAIIPFRPDVATARVNTRGAEELVVTAPANQGEWWVLYRVPAATAFGAARSTQRTVWFGALLVAAVAVGALFWL